MKYILILNPLESVEAIFAAFSSDHQVVMNYILTLTAIKQARARSDRSQKILYLHYKHIF